MGQCWQHQALMSVAVGDKDDKGSIMVTTGDVCRGHWLGCMLVAVLWMAPAIFSTGTSGCGRQSSRWWSEWPCWALEVTCGASAPVPVRSRPSSDPAQFSHWLHRAMMSLHILLALSCVVLLALVLMKSEWGFGFAFWWRGKGLGQHRGGPQGPGRPSAAPNGRTEAIQSSSCSTSPSRTDSELSQELLVLKREIWNGERRPGVRGGVGGQW